MRFQLFSLLSVTKCVKSSTVWYRFVTIKRACCILNDYKPFLGENAASIGIKIYVLDAHMLKEHPLLQGFLPSCSMRSKSKRSVRVKKRNDDVEMRLG